MCWWVCGALGARGCWCSLQGDDWGGVGHCSVCFMNLPCHVYHGKNSPWWWFEFKEPLRQCICFILTVNSTPIIPGVPNVRKSSFFNALSNSGPSSLPFHTFHSTHCWSISYIPYLVLFDYLIIATSHTSFYLSLLSDLLSILQV